MLPPLLPKDYLLRPIHTPKVRPHLRNKPPKVNSGNRDRQRVPRSQQFRCTLPAGALGLLGAFAGIGRAEESSICWKLKPDDAFFVPVGEWGWAVEVVRCPTAFSGCGRLVTILGAGRMSSEGSEDSSLVAEEGISTYCRVAIACEVERQHTTRSRYSKPEVALE